MKWIINLQGAGLPETRIAKEEASAAVTVLRVVEQKAA
jgi:hypothetical protein